MRPFQIIFNPSSVAELARVPKELQLQILGEFRGLPQQVMNTRSINSGNLSEPAGFYSDFGLEIIASISNGMSLAWLCIEFSAGTP